MNKLPRKNKQWVEETSNALEEALAIFLEQYPKPTEEENLQLLNYSVPFAAVNRGIKDIAEVKKANQFVSENLEYYFETKDDDEEINYSILFILAYLDAHISFGIFNQKKSEEIMKHLVENYDLN